MADPLPHDQPCLSAFMRVQRGIETAQDLITSFPALEEAALDSGLTEQDCRRLLDYPDAEEEAANIRRVSPRTRAELLSTATSRPADLSDAELELLAAGFWADVTLQEVDKALRGKLVASAASVAVQKRVDQARYAAAELAPLESFACSKARTELRKRRKRREDENTAARLGASQHHTTPAWMNDLTRQFQEEHEGSINRWGFIALYDAEAQETTSAEDRDLFEVTVEDILRANLMTNGAKANAIAQQWRLHFYDAPRLTSTADTTTTTTVSSSSADKQVGDYGTTLRNAFRAFLDSAEWLKVLQWDQGVRTDVFLVVNKECINSVLGRFLDDMRIAAYEADFTPGASYTDGYEGWTWVRLEQLVYRFYGAACTRDDVKLHDIWRAAQASRHNAFVSLDPEVAQGWTMSMNITGQQQPRYDVHF